jgi:hypothetical protein
MIFQRAHRTPPQVASAPHTRRVCAPYDVGLRPVRGASVYIAAALLLSLLRLMRTCYNLVERMQDALGEIIICESVYRERPHPTRSASAPRTGPVCGVCALYRARLRLCRPARGASTPLSRFLCALKSHIRKMRVLLNPIYTVACSTCARNHILVISMRQ